MDEELKIDTEAEDREDIAQAVGNRSWSQSTWDAIAGLGKRYGAKKGEEILFGEVVLGRLRMHRIMNRVMRVSVAETDVAKLATVAKVLAQLQTAIDASVASMVVMSREKAARVIKSAPVDSPVDAPKKNQLLPPPSGLDIEAMFSGANTVDPSPF